MRWTASSNLYVQRSQCELVKTRRGKAQTGQGPQPPDSSVEEMHAEIAKRLSLALVSYMMQTSYETAKKNYGRLAPSAYWMDLAERVCSDYSSGRFGS